MSRRSSVNTSLQSERKYGSCEMIDHQKRMKDMRPRVTDRQQNLTKYGFPSTNEEKNNNAIRNTVMKDNNPEMENENLVTKENHVQNAVKLTRQQPGADATVKTSGINPASIGGTINRIYDKMVVSRQEYMKQQGVVTVHDAKQKMKEKQAQTKERDTGIALTTKEGMSLENYMRSLHNKQWVDKHHGFKF